jgi:hypothetical protein
MDMELEKIRRSPEILNAIDWDLTPEEAVMLYLEWGGSWTPGVIPVRSSSDESYYFMVSTWDARPKVRLMRMSHADAEELAVINVPEEIMERYLATLPKTKNVYPINQEIRSWLETEFFQRPS